MQSKNIKFAGNSSFAITTDTTCDLPAEYILENDIGLLALCYTIDGETYRGYAANSLSDKVFYDKMRAGSMPQTMQVNPEQAKEVFEAILKERKNILHIAFSSGLSGSYNSALMAAQELCERYPDNKIVVVDSLCACMGEGLLVYKVAEMRKAGKSFDEVCRWAEQNKLHVIHNVAVDDLNHLHRGGRVSKASAVVGTMMGIKPILKVDNEGKLLAVDKVRGRKQALTHLVTQMEEQLGAYQNDVVFIAHADCLEDAKFVQDTVKKRLGIKNFVIHSIGPTIGAHAGPGTVALFFMGQQR